jgi:ATP-dependent RNA helicase DDX19/DBP5
MSKQRNIVRGQLLSEPIVIGTPGTVEDWCRRLRVINLSKLRICCIDEADVMIGVGDVQPTCAYILSRLNRSNCQMMLFSTTYSDEVMSFAREIVRDPVVLTSKREKQMLTNIKQFFIRCYDPQQKYYAIRQIYAQITVEKAMIFCRTKYTALDLLVRMELQKHSVREIISILDIEQRETCIKQFRQGVFRVLISTDIAARRKFISIIFFRLR